MEEAIALPTASIHGADIYYEVQGEGYPLILIMGLGANIDWWGTGFIKQLARHHKVVALDNRGAGRTRTPDGPFRIEDMAADVAGLMDELSIERADVYGMSMGGMIAQEFALTYAERIHRLILGCTSCGSHQQVMPTPLAATLLMAAPATLEEAMEHQAKLLFPDEFVDKNRPLLVESYKVLIRHPMSRENFVRQFGAIQAWQGSFDRLHAISCPTLILHGTEDILLPVGNAEILHDHIPGSHLIRYEGCGHAFTVQMATRVLADIEEFLLS
ncbi:alpha/beta fold hydrolase [Alicyclobacillus dauci]|uniref:Alpha/beta hydrolase n=1 Tax=Alicyclobacillus dauci TaxID=1475485 RepID=A0ABY6Z4S9_9BACL|nr:alpha/beta hydrolase [Alicyclobacillus dauci]WAH37883.1 alpha/beta hydrolase [Alicyclobacillus dauci]